jgi:hypothetical protein
MFLKSIGFFEKPQFHWNCFLKALQSLIDPHIKFKKSLNFSENIFKMPRILKKSLAALSQWPPEKPIVCGESATRLNSLFFSLGKSTTLVKQMYRQLA